MACWSKEYPCGAKGSCGGTTTRERAHRRTRWWVRLVLDGEVLFFKDGFRTPEEAQGWADEQMHSWEAEASDARMVWESERTGGRL